MATAHKTTKFHIKKRMSLGFIRVVFNQHKHKVGYFLLSELLPPNTDA